ncbi:DUF4192 family protein [Agrococcus sp. Ld7]|uniref:DUF4192 family protein n=1 Tax=Agrococcus sp. Ld7 TaxID=649148 RepID=UPI0038679200
MLHDLKQAPDGGRVHLPRVDDATTNAVLDEFEAMRDALPKLSIRTSARYGSAVVLLDVPRHGEALTISMGLVETCLDEDPRRPDPEMLAQLLFLSLWPALPEQMAMQIAFGWDAATSHVHDLVPVVRHAARSRRPAEELFAGMAVADAVPGTPAGCCFRGHADEKPDRARVGRGIALFREVAAHAPVAFRPSLLCVVAWLLWANGKRPHALAYLAEAGRVQPDHALTRSLSDLCSTALPKWCADRSAAFVRSDSSGK